LKKSQACGVRATQSFTARPAERKHQQEQSPDGVCRQIIGMIFVKIICAGSAINTKGKYGNNPAVANRKFTVYA
jgi:hypothetical protein